MSRRDPPRQHRSSREVTPAPSPRSTYDDDERLSERLSPRNPRLSRPPSNPDSPGLSLASRENSPVPSLPSLQLPASGQHSPRYSLPSRPGTSGQPSRSTRNTPQPATTQPSSSPAAYPLAHDTSTSYDQARTDLRPAYGGQQQLRATQGAANYPYAPANQGAPQAPTYRRTHASLSEVPPSRRRAGGSSGFDPPAPRSTDRTPASHQGSGGTSVFEGPPGPAPTVGAVTQAFGDIALTATASARQPLPGVEVERPEPLVDFEENRILYLKDKRKRGTLKEADQSELDELTKRKSAWHRYLSETREATALARQPPLGVGAGRPGQLTVYEDNRIGYIRDKLKRKGTISTDEQSQLDRLLRKKGAWDSYMDQIKEAEEEQQMQAREAREGGVQERAQQRRQEAAAKAKQEKQERGAAQKTEQEKLLEMLRTQDFSKWTTADENRFFYLKGIEKKAKRPLTEGELEELDALSRKKCDDRLAKLQERARKRELNKKELNEMSQLLSQRAKWATDMPDVTRLLDPSSSTAATRDPSPSNIQADERGSLTTSRSAPPGYETASWRSGLNFNLAEAVVHGWDHAQEAAERRHDARTGMPQPLPPPPMSTDAIPRGSSHRERRGQNPSQPDQPSRRRARESDSPPERQPAPSRSSGHKSDPKKHKKR